MARLLVCLTLLASVARADVPARAVRVSDTAWAPWERWRIERSVAPLEVFVAHDQARRPLVVLVQGSVCVPLLNVIGTRRPSTLPFERELHAELGRAHFAAVERRGLASFSGVMPADASCTPAHGGVSKEERVADVADAVSALAAQPWVSSVVLLGYSEGADVAAGAARRLGARVRAVGLVGPGPSQLFDHVVVERRTGHDDEAQRVFSEMLALTSAAPPAQYRGFPVERYLSYAIRSTALDDLRALDVPVFVAQGTRDESSPVESADLFVVELLRNPHRTLRYLVLPGLDHDFVGPTGDDHSAEVLAAFLDWTLGGFKPARSVETRRLGPPARPR